ncbi:RepB family plasmid replication initiator protein [Enterobacter hormaechei]|uniref:RepB family plasmid replication initiator protein n=1 Tax=Enterobacter hormaechei TaxID=158836 RepID=UPI0018ED3A7C|nr:RepB family plasmid replication initiator protein [Enterobacter hormaechei]MBJ6416683.1 RepB family plasmid replication initiator protein [Enterobacter hormaechei]MBJ6565051.1 RepB family plasmid replication initiator protein [Enterobacter hormaechei]MBK4522022.1 RepB family plasmid replication initiator protein [Enterobacter hormaechei]MBK4540054.1 RepB family plasmid replication initiator protein [Enterobacter hormaechei]MBK4585510.1 RepB family plasmid replication initiator protein [Ente
MASENNKLPLNLQEVDKSTGEVVNLDVNSTSTVQPVALMRLGLFVPTLKSTGKSKANRKNVTDATEELVQLSIAKSEGYTDIKITGSRLDMDTDFKVWLGIIRSMSEYGVKKDSLELSFVEFVKMCGFDSRRSNKKMRDRISNSLFKLASVTLKFQSETKGWTTHLVQSAYYDINEDIIEIKAEPKLFELYHMDRRVLLRLKAIDALQRKESAQALYTYIESLPQNPVPISMKRMRDRLNLTSNVYTQNHTVRKAMEQLKDIGYLDYTEFKRGRSTYFSVHYRNPKLISSSGKVVPRDEDEKKPEQNYDEVIKALKAAGIDPQKLAEALTNMKPEN